MSRMKVALVGCGNIGADLCIALQKGDIPAEIVALNDIDESRANLLNRSFQLNADVCSIEEAAAEADFLAECAVAEAVGNVLEAAVHHHKDCLILSVSGLMGHPELFEKAKANGVHIRIPSGAICGLDGIRAAMEAGLHTVTLSIRKPPQGIEGAPYLLENGIDIDRITEAKLVFEGNALEAVEAFPATVNVASALSIVGIGPLETKVRIIADPMATENSHEIRAEGAFGRLQTVTTNLPSPRNAKSSYLASLSAAAELRAAAQVFVTHRAEGLKEYSA